MRGADREAGPARSGAIARTSTGHLAPTGDTPVREERELLNPHRTFLIKRTDPPGPNDGENMLLAALPIPSQV